MNNTIIQFRHTSCLHPPTGITGTCSEMALFHWNTQPSRGNRLKIIHKCITAPKLT